jgi:hypothetical protein
MAMHQDEFTLAALIEQTICALTVNDAPRLQELLQRAETIRASAQSQQSLPSVPKRNLLAAVLNETARNLRLFERVYRRAGSLESLVGYGRRP